MGTRCGTTYEAALLCLVLLVNVLILSCAPTVLPPPTPPENYKGPIAEHPILQQGDYWVYELGNLTRVKTTALATNIGFPLWIGKTWSYEGQGLPIGQMSPTSKRFRVPTQIDCNVVAFNQVALALGSFAAFECECRCTVTGSPGNDPWCGDWKIWYAPEVKNIIRRKTDSTETSLELVQYRASRPAPGEKVGQEKIPGNK